MKLKLFASALALLSATSAFGAEKPDAVRVGIAAFLSGPASVFGEPAKAGAEMMAEEINAKGGIHGVPLELSFIDEGAGGEALLAEYRRLAEDVKVDAIFAGISSGNCTKIAPLAEDLKVMNIMWDCGTQRIFEEASYRYNFRTQANATPEMLATVLYLLKMKPDMKTIAVVNQDYAWGRDSWAIFSTALKQFKPDVKVVAEFFPKFGAPDFSTEISRLQALRPDVILSTSWGGDLDTFVRQANQRGLTRSSTLVLPLAESSLERLGSALPAGHIVGARGDHYFLHPEEVGKPEFDAFVTGFKEKTGAYPIYSVFHMKQAMAAFTAAYDKAIAANGGEWPTDEQVVDAMQGLTFEGFGRPIHIREDHQGVEAQLLGVTKTVDAYPFPVLDQMEIYDGEAITAPVGKTSIEWIQTLDPSFPETVKAQSFSYGG